MGSEVSQESIAYIHGQLSLTNGFHYVAMASICGASRGCVIHRYSYELADREASLRPRAIF